MSSFVEPRCINKYFPPFYFLVIIKNQLECTFLHFRDFFERVILCNSLVWSCSITGRAGLTYQEAVECEEKALKNLATFPSYLQKPILFLATLTHRSRLNDMNDDVFVFAKDRYFIGEIVDVIIGNERYNNGIKSGLMLSDLALSALSHKDASVSR